MSRCRGLSASSSSESRNLQAEYGDEEYPEGNSACETDPQCHLMLPGSHLHRVPRGGIGPPVQLTFIVLGRGKLSDFRHSREKHCGDQCLLWEGLRRERVEMPPWAWASPLKTRGQRGMSEVEMPVDDLGLSLLKGQPQVSEAVFASSDVQERRCFFGLPPVQPVFPDGFPIQNTFFRGHSRRIQSARSTCWDQTQSTPIRRLLASNEVRVASGPLAFIRRIVDAVWAHPQGAN